MLLEFHVFFDHLRQLKRLADTAKNPIQLLLVVAFLHLLGRAIDRIFLKESLLIVRLRCFLQRICFMNTYTLLLFDLPLQHIFTNFTRRCKMFFLLTCLSNFSLRRKGKLTLVARDAHLLDATNARVFAKLALFLHLVVWLHRLVKYLHAFVMLDLILRLE